MAKITLAQARRMLPNGCSEFAPHAVTVAALRDAVMQELEAYKDGENPLTTGQVARFRSMLQRTA